MHSQGAPFTASRAVVEQPWAVSISCGENNMSLSKMKMLIFLISMLLYKEMFLYYTFAFLRAALEYSPAIFPSAWISKFK